MPDRERIIEEIKKLIADYNAISDKEKRDMSEANIRKGFIDRFFDEKILGWAFRDANEYDAESYVRGVGFADVCIKVDGKPKMFIEAKKFGGVPSRRDRSIQTTLSGHKIYADWTDEERQVLNYAGATVGVKWAILTNFEKFRLFNAKTGETVLNIEKPGEYLEKIDEILLLTKENVLNGNIDKLEDRVERPDVDIHFLNLIKKWQLILANELYKNNPSLNLDEINLYVQRILDRLVIVRYAEDNWVLDNPDQLRTIRESANKSDYVSLNDILINFFNGFDDEHNSKIFEKNEDINEIIRNIDDEIFNGLIEELYYQSFRKFTSDILGNTYESYLSSKLCLEDGKLHLQYLYQSRKDQGIYYTPPYIVNQIIKNTLGNKLEILWNEVLDLFYKKEYENAVSKFKEIYHIKVLDPACGSGSFLIKAHDAFLEYYNKYEIQIKKANRELKELVADGQIKEWDFTNLTELMKEPLKNFERRILKKNIYGVDLDENAAEIASVNLMLRALKPHQKLPLILYENIKVGNSLITGVDDLDELMEHSDQIKELMRLREEIKNTQDLEKKSKLEIEHDYLKNEINEELNDNLSDYFEDITNIKPFNWEIEFPEVFYDDNGKLKEDEGGFDVVIGNPPYFNIQTLGAKSPEVNFIMDYFSDIWMDKSDILFYFIAKAIQLTKQDVGYIVSNAFTFADKAKKLRNYILENASVEKIINFEKYMVFKEASITTCIIFLNKLKEDTVASALSFKNSDYSEDEIINTINNELSYFDVKFKKDDPFALINDETDVIYDKIDDNHSKLGELVLIGKGMETAADSVFLFNEYPSQFPARFIKKRVSGKNTDKFFLNPRTDYILYFEDVEEFEDLPNSIKDHLLQNREILENRADKKRRNTSKWWNYTFAMHKEYYDLPKLFCSRRARHNTFGIDEGFKYLSFSNMTVVFETNDQLSIKYILALLNSRVLDFRYKGIGKQTGGGIYEYFPNGIAKLPIPEISLKEQESFINLVNILMGLNKQRYELISSFVNLVRISKQNSMIIPLGYYLNLKNASDYKINLSNTEILIDENKEGKPRKYNVYEVRDCLYINVTYDDNSSEDVLKIHFDDPVLKEFFFLAIFYIANVLTKAYRSDKNVLNTLLSDLTIPKYKKNKEKDVENIEMLMDNLAKGYSNIIDEKYADSPVQEFGLNIINGTIKKIDDYLNTLVYRLYGIDEEEIRFIEVTLG